MVTYKVYTFVYFNVDYHHQEHLFVREWNDSQFQNTRGGVQAMKFWIVRLLKTLIFGRSKHLKNSSKILANTFSDSLAILKKICRLTPANFFHRKVPSSLPVPITLSITHMDSLPVLFPFLLKERHTAGGRWVLELWAWRPWMINFLPTRVGAITILGYNVSFFII